MKLHRASSTLLAALAVAAGAVASSGGSVGTPYCSANPNTTGQIGLLTATGSTDVTLNDLTLTGSQLPPDQFCLFVTSQTQAFVPNPGGSNGNLCLGGQIGRYMGNIVNAGPAGVASLQVDLTAVPLSNSLYAVQAGETVNFQLWHRDGPTGSNFTEGLEITFDGGGTNPTFEQDIYPMLQQPAVNGSICIVCHGPAALGGLGLGSTAASAYAALVDVESSCNGLDYVEPGNSSASFLVEKLMPGPSCGSQMPLGDTFTGDVNVIMDWIDSGAAF